jgi:hypothetical protein
MRPDGSDVVTGHEIGAARWRADGTLIRRLDGHTDRVLDVGFAAGEGSAITASRDAYGTRVAGRGGTPIVLMGHD